VVCLQDGLVSEAAVGIPGATGRAFAADTASASLIGKSLSSETTAEAALLASERAEFLSDHYALGTIANTSSRPRFSGRWHRSLQPERSG
jgi:CO/xanthine dehydrogenase FAD-binding subunit